ncbi:guanosine-3',5'-bis(diphosphate) 3'-pyrophosphohydrolase MESH1-like isoform X1 [Diadema setosum]|uniref:guanosine-3',5'-bis(diphosphate) 3'-pyrophosphohydrolase MESH1-like isoform X1 n=1 Tax=Diadema setosum TaxID=31175 RepID=UPI003B3A5515
MDLVELVECADFAARKHKDQRRKNAAATPYINHPIGVARILAKEADVTDLATLQAALLHDTVEDTDTTFDEIEKLFGKEVRDIVADVTDDKSLPKMERKRRQVEHASHCSPKAKLVKLADKLYNLRDLDREVPQGWTQERAQEYFQWASQVVQGLRGSSQALERRLDELFKKHDVIVET